MIAVETADRNKIRDKMAGTTTPSATRIQSFGACNVHKLTGHRVHGRSDVISKEIFYCFIFIIM